MIFIRIALTLISMFAFLSPLALANLSPAILLSPTPNTFSQTVSPEPVEIFCPGGLVLQGGESGTKIGEFEVIANSQIQVVGDGYSPSEVPNSSAGGISITAAISETEQSTLDLVANSLAAVSSKRMAGLASLNCAQPVSRGILLGGDTQVGTETLLIVSNPQEIETIVTLKILGLESEPSETLVLASGEQKYISLAALSGDSSTFAVEFESSAGAVSVVMQQRTISGLSPTGVELSDWALGAARSQVFPAIKVVGSGLAPEKALGQPLLRLYNPTELLAKTDVLLVSASSSRIVSVQTQPGSFSETYLDLSDGNWSAFLSSDQEILAALRNPVFASRADFEWLNPASPISNALAIPSWASAELHIANPSAQSVQYQVTGIGQITVAGNSRSTIAVQPGELIVESDGEILATLTILNDDGYAAIEPRENQNFGSNLQVVIY